MPDITALILTYNEEKNIGLCIESLSGVANRVCVVDSYSTDNTVSVAKAHGAEVLQHVFENYSKQYNWGIDNFNISSKWIFRIDADERLTEASAQEVVDLCNANENTDINGIIVRYIVTFLGKELKHGGIYPFRKLLVYKNGKGYMENRNMDEHIVLTEGKSVNMKNDSLHYDFKDLTTWIDKHNKYSNREALDYFESIDRVEDVSKLNKLAHIKRFVKFKIYYKLPMSTRAHLYYIYRYYIRLGFLDGKEGQMFAFLQAYWYRYLVDAKIYEKKLKDKQNEKIKDSNS